MVPESLKQAVATHLGDAIEAVEPVGGGCISNAMQIRTSEASYFLKWGTGEVAETFPVEAHGLKALAQANSDLHIPTVFHVQDESDDAPAWLLMEWIDAGTKHGTFWERLGRGLADMHQHTADRYGFDEDNFIGQLPQKNDRETDWPTFFHQHRLEPQIRMARDRGRWDDSWDRYAGRLLNRLDGWLPDEPEPSILHGDLWSGNVMADAEENGVLIDPAVYYGHREADLAMSELFGGFDHTFYGAYREAWPLEPGYEQRRDIYNLYHLINHLNHFGSGYADSVESTLRRYG